MDEKMTLATELLHELKASARRWFIIAVVELAAIVLIIAAFLWYISLPVEEYEYSEQYVEDIDASTITQTMEGD